VFPLCALLLRPSFVQLDASISVPNGPVRYHQSNQRDFCHLRERFLRSVVIAAQVKNVPPAEAIRHHIQNWQFRGHACWFEPTACRPNTARHPDQHKICHAINHYSALLFLRDFMWILLGRFSSSNIKPVSSNL